MNPGESKETHCIHIYNAHLNLICFLYHLRLKRQHSIIHPLTFLKKKLFLVADKNCQPKKVLSFSNVSLFNIKRNKFLFFPVTFCNWIYPCSIYQRAYVCLYDDDSVGRLLIFIQLSSSDILQNG